MVMEEQKSVCIVLPAYEAIIRSRAELTSYDLTPFSMLSLTTQRRLQCLQSPLPLFLYRTHRALGQRSVCLLIPRPLAREEGRCSEGPRRSLGGRKSKERKRGSIVYLSHHLTATPRSSHMHQLTRRSAAPLCLTDRCCLLLLQRRMMASNSIFSC